MWDALEQGDILGVRFGDDKNNRYLDFIQHCFVNFLISGVHVKIETMSRNLLFITLAAPGIDRIEEVISKFRGELIC